jgi:hypothetical protein
MKFISPWSTAERTLGGVLVAQRVSHARWEPATSYQDTLQHPDFKCLVNISNPLFVQTEGFRGHASLQSLTVVVGRSLAPQVDLHIPLQHAACIPHTSRDIDLHLHTLVIFP